MALPGVVAQIGKFWRNLLSLGEDQTEVIVLHSVCQVDVSADLALVTLVSDEEDRCQAAIPQTFFALGQCLEERVPAVRVACMRQCLDLSLLLVLSGLDSSLLALLKLRAGKKLCLTVAADLVESSNQLRVFEVEEILVRALRVQVVLIRGVVVQVRVEQVSFVVFSHIQIFFFQ